MPSWLLSRDDRSHNLLFCQLMAAKSQNMQPGAFPFAGNTAERSGRFSAEMRP